MAVGFSALGDREFGESARRARCARCGLRLTHRCAVRLSQQTATATAPDRRGARGETAGGPRQPFAHRQPGCRPQRPSIWGRGWRGAARRARWLESDSSSPRSRRYLPRPVTHEAVEQRSTAPNVEPRQRGERRDALQGSGRIRRDRRVAPLRGVLEVLQLSRAISWRVEEMLEAALAGVRRFGVRQRTPVHGRRTEHRAVWPPPQSRSTPPA